MAKNREESEKLRGAVSLFLNNNFDVVKIQEFYDGLEPREKLIFLKDLLPFAIPKYATTEYIPDEVETGKRYPFMDRMKQAEKELNNAANS